MCKKSLFLSQLLSLITLLAVPNITQAAIFDAGDFQATKSTSIGAFGELILNDPSSEGAQANFRYGLSDEWNVAGIIGSGSNNKGFRLGGEAVYNFFPDADGQFGVSAIGTVLYLRRGNGGIYTRIAPMVHKKLGIGGYSTILYVAFPFHFEARAGNTSSGSQVAVGSLFDIARGSRTYLAAELGISLSKSESYALMGVGFRFGELKWGNSDNAKNIDKKLPNKKKNNDEDEKEYRTEDFNQPIN